MKKIYIPLALLLLLGLLLLISTDTVSHIPVIGKSQEERLEKEWLELGVSIKEAREKAERGEEPLAGQSQESELPLSLQGPTESSEIPEAALGANFSKLAADPEYCQDLCQKYFQQTIYGSSSKIYYEDNEVLFLASALCIERNRERFVTRPFLTEMQLVEGQWEIIRFFVSLNDFIKEKGAPSPADQKNLRSLKQSLLCE